MDSTPPILTLWQPVVTQIPEEWMIVARTLSRQVSSTQHIYVLDTIYDAEGVGALLRSWGLPWQVVMAGVLWEHEERVRSINVKGAEQVLSHINESKHYAHDIEDENLPPLLTYPYRDLGALLIAVATYFLALRTLQKQSNGQPYSGTLQASIDRMADTLLDIVKRLGMWYFKRNVEDLREHLCHPDKFIQAKQEHDRILKKDAMSLKAFRQLLIATYQKTTHQQVIVEATACGIAGMERRKQDAHTTATSQKTQLTGFDLVTFDIIVPTVRECYAAFGTLSQLGYIQDRVTDQIATPKPNGYSQIAFGLVPKPQMPYTNSDTALRVCQLQIATDLMHSIKVYGCLYPTCFQLYEQPLPFEGTEPLKDEQLWNSKEGHVFYTIKMDLSHIQSEKKNPIVVYSKNRTPKALPKGATALDFAFALDETGTIGMHAVEALINNRKASLHRKLGACDIVEIRTSSEIQVQEHWRKEAITPLAQRYINERLNQRSLDLKNYYLLRQSLERANYTPPVEALNTELDLLVKQYNLGTRQEYLRQLDGSKAPPYTLDWAAQKIIQQIRERNEPKPESNASWVPVLDRLHGSKKSFIRQQHLCNFCKPSYLHDDMQITGCLRKGSRNLVVHRENCPHLINQNGNQQSQLLSMTWQLQPPAFEVAFFLKAQDRRGLIHDITKQLLHHQCNLLHVNAEVIQFVEAHIRLTIVAHTDKEVLDYWQELYNIENVTSVEIDKSYTPITIHERLQKLREKSSLLPERTTEEIIWEEVVETLQPRNAVLKSPFDISRPATATMFFGRSSETHTLQRELCDGDQGKALILYGPRRSGKSSICKNFIERQKRPSFCSVFYSLQAAVDQTEVTILMRLADEICSAFSEQLQLLTPDWSDYSDKDSEVRFKSILQACLARSPGTRLILALDEFGGALDSYQRHILEYRFFTYWKELISEIPELSLLIALPTSAHRTLTSSNFSNSFSFAESLSIRFLDNESAERLLADPLRDQQIAVHPHTLAYAVKLTGGNPYYMTLLGDQLIHQLNREPLKQWVADEDLRFVVDQIIERGSNQNFTFLKPELQNSDEMHILEAIVELTHKTNQPMVQLKRIAAMVDSAPEVVRKHLERMRNGLILEENAPREKRRSSSNPYYSFKIELVRQWLTHNHWFFTTSE